MLLKQCLPRSVTRGYLVEERERVRLKASSQLPGNGCEKPDPTFPA